MKSYRWVLVFVLALSLGFPALTASAATPQLPLAVRTAGVSITAPTPNPGLIGSDIIFDMLINVTDVTPGVAGAEIYLGYDPALVTPPTTPGGAAEIMPGFFGASTVSINEVLPAGQCPGSAGPCIHLVVAGPAQITQNGVAARFHFRGITEGSACFSVLQSVLVDADGFNVIHTAGQGQCATIQFRVIASGLVQRQGVPANPNTGAGTLACASVSTTGTAILGPVFTNSTGAFSIANMAAGTYTFRATYPGYLAAEKAGVVVAGSGSTTLNVGTVTLRGGDANSDNAINILDIGAIISKFGSTGLVVKSASANCAASDDTTDINDDGTVNISDLAIAAGNWGSVGPKVWP